MWLRSRVILRDERDYAAEDRHLAAQRQACEIAATNLDAAIIQEYAEHGGTGAIAKRPVVRQMLDELLALRDVDYVITAGLDRLARNARDLHAIRLELEVAGVELVIAGQERPAIAQYRMAYTAAAASNK